MNQPDEQQRYREKKSHTLCIPLNSCKKHRCAADIDLYSRCFFTLNHGKYFVHHFPKSLGANID